MIAYRFHPEAKEELDDIMLFYKNQQAGLEKRFFDTFEDVIARIRKHPFMYREIEEDIRKCRTPRFPYVVVYRVKSDGIQIIAIMHIRRNPDYWKTRI